MNFKALSARVATRALYDALDTLECKKEKNRVEKLIINQAKNTAYHVDYQNYGFVVCKAKINYSRLNESTSQRITEFEPVSERIFSLDEACTRANRLEEAHNTNAYREPSDLILNYTI